MIDNFALIIGAMKSGTTSIFNYLSQHAQVSGCTIKEPRFFSDDSKWPKGFEWYRSLWNWNPDVHNIALEASTDYTKVPRFPNAAERIATLKANFKFIYIIRNPIERIESHYNHGRLAGWCESIKPIETGIDFHLIEITKYATQIEEYYKRFPSRNILIVDFEDLKHRPQELLRNICRFLKVESNYQFYNLNHIHHNAKVMKFTSHPFWKMAINFPLCRKIAKFIPHEHKQIALTYVTKMTKGKYKLNSKQREFVFCELKDDLRKLSLEYGFDVSRWGFEV